MTHVRFTTDEQSRILSLKTKAYEDQQAPYREWEEACKSMNWFDGETPISLASVKSHMPRAMLFTLQFPVDQNPRIVKADVDRLLAAEAKYEESTKASRELDSYLIILAEKYGISGWCIHLDADMGGAMGD